MFKMDPGIIATIAAILTQYCSFAALPEPSAVNEEQRQTLSTAFICYQSCDEQYPYSIVQPDPFDRDATCPIYTAVLECVFKCGDDIARVFKQHVNAQIAENQWILNECFADKSSPEFKKYIMTPPPRHSELTCMYDCLGNTKLPTELEAKNYQIFCDTMASRMQCLRPCGEAGVYMMIIDAEKLHRECEADKQAIGATTQSAQELCAQSCMMMALIPVEDAELCASVVVVVQCFTNCGLDATELLMQFYANSGKAEQVAACNNVANGDTSPTRSKNTAQKYNFSKRWISVLVWLSFLFGSM